MIELGDYVAQMHPSLDSTLKKGIVVSCDHRSFTVQWLSYNKDFWMDYTGDVFKELNDRYLLSKMSYNRENENIDIAILSKAGENVVG
jgi:hypothetical protein